MYPLSFSRRGIRQCTVLDSATPIRKVGLSSALLAGETEKRPPLCCGIGVKAVPGSSQQKLQREFLKEEKLRLLCGASQETKTATARGHIEKERDREMQRERDRERRTRPLNVADD